MKLVVKRNGEVSSVLVPQMDESCEAEFHLLYHKKNKKNLYLFALTEK